MRIQEIDDTGKPYKIYSENIEQEALNQFIKTMQQPAVVQGALMPDAHCGYTLPIGAVVACKAALFPSFVGYDIGCGMCAVPTTFSCDGVEDNKKAIFDQIYRDVPVGFAHNSVGTGWSYEGKVSDFARDLYASGACEKQIGTLGGGNHFIEIGHDERDMVWIIIHSGSRNVGHKIATHYMKLASGDGKAREDHFPLWEGTAEFKDYRNDLAFGLDFALANRRLIIKRVEAAIQRTLPNGYCEWESLINRNHNHAEFKMLPLNGSPDHVHGVWIHRKGATHAEEGMLGVIPGNMRDGSFIVRGKGNPDSLFSSSHGAGRVLGRKAAQKALSVATFIEEMEAAGVQAKVGFDTVDESRHAYKDIFEVMRLQSDLVDVIHHVKPLINIKG